MDEVFRRLGIRVRIKLNNRKMLAGIAEIIGASERIADITVAMDKLDKIGLENVNAELRDKGLSEEAVAQLQPLIGLQGTNREKLTALALLLQTSDVGQKGIEETAYILDRTEGLSLTAELTLDVTLARGLSYYTGAIFEVKAVDVEIGSITGGGRYDNLTGVFGMDGLSGVGISFGADRIYDVLNQLDLYPKNLQQVTQVLFVNFGLKEETLLLPLAARLRQADIRVEIYPDAAKIKKQMSYADARNIPYVALIGETEIAAGVVLLKDMVTGSQIRLTHDELINHLRFSN